MVLHVLVVIYCSIRRLEMYKMNLYCPGYKICSSCFEQGFENFSIP